MRDISPLAQQLSLRSKLLVSLVASVGLWLSCWLLHSLGLLSNSVAVVAHGWTLHLRVSPFRLWFWQWCVCVSSEFLAALGLLE